MSYLVLARKSRPQNFAQVVGQQPVVRTLRNALLRNRVPHALIFSGVRGTGKTTLARIMAKAINCEQGTPPEPCCQCRSCREIAAGSSVDLHEIDGASNRGIQEIRELKENIRFMPVSARFKIIIIDEVHMLTTEAFNALLKTLEEPPGHVYFMFATTELHKVPVTILSRCQRYELKRVPSRELAAHFAALAAGEGVEVESAALNMVVRAAGGSVRDGLSLLDQLFSYCGGKVSAAEAAEVLGMVGMEAMASTARALLAGDLAVALEHLDDAVGRGMDVKRFGNELLSWFRSLVVCRTSKDPARLLDLPEDEMALLVETAAGHSPQSLFLLFNLLMEGIEKAAWSARPRFAMEMAFIRAVQASDVVPVTELLERLDGILAGAPMVLAAESAEPNWKKKTLAEPAARTSDQAKPKPLNAPRLPAEPSPASPPCPASARPEGTGSESPAGERDIRKQWQEFVASVRKRLPWMAPSLDAASPHLANGRLVLKYADPVECSILREKEKLAQLAALVLDFFQEDLQISLSVPEGGRTGEEGGAAEVQKERQALAHDQLVTMAAEIFNGQVGDIRVDQRFRGPMPSESADEGEDSP